MRPGLSRRSLLLTAGAALARLAPARAEFAQSSLSKERLIVRSVRPQDLETPVALLDSWITPNDLFYVRSHLYTPEIAPNGWRLKVDGLVEKPLEIGLGALKALPRASLAVTLECAGDGRGCFHPAVPGIQWEKGAVGPRAKGQGPP